MTHANEQNGIRRIAINALDTVFIVDAVLVPGGNAVDVGALALGGNPMQDARSQGDRRGGF